MIHRGDKDRHPEIFKRPGMRRTALLDVNLIDSEKFRESLRFDQRRIPFTKRDDVLFFQFWKNQFLFGPDAAATTQARLE